MDVIIAWWDGLDDLARLAFRDGCIIVLALILA